MKYTTVDVADMKLSKDPQEILVAPSLGSCIAISIHDPGLKAGGILIFMLPSVREIADEALKGHVYMFADTGVPAFFQAAKAFGIAEDRVRVILVGGGQVLGQQGACDIGTRNIELARSLLSELGVQPVHQSVGGNFNRTLNLEIDSGVTTITFAGNGVETL